MKLESGDYCPLVGGPCKKWECKWWIQLRGNHPQTGEPIDEWDCSITMLPMLIIEASSQARQAGAAVESFRNVSYEQTQELTKVMVQAQEIVPAILAETLNNKGIIEGKK